MSVEPYREITFDADGDPDARQRAALDGLDVTDLVVFAHGWNNSRKIATSLYSRFYAPFPGLLGDGGARVGYAGVVWPAMRFADEPIPDFGSLVGRDAETDPDALDAETCRMLVELFPGEARTVAELAVLLAERPESREAFDDFGRLVRRLVAVPFDSPDARYRADAQPDALPRSDLAILSEDTLKVCTWFTQALADAGAGSAPEPARPAALGGGLKKLWKGAKELLRQATYYAMKRRAGKVGELGLGPLLGRLARTRPGTRVHLVGHSQGARLVGFALRGLPEGARNVKSLTLVQGAFSHYAFSGSVPHSTRSRGVLSGLQARVDGPVVGCYSRYDTALGVIYPLASKLAGDSTTAAPARLDRRWWAMGADGIQAVPGTPDLTLERALREGLPAAGCVSVDTAAVVKDGGPPSGAHSDICHEELARLVLLAGRIGGVRDHTG
ncbi:serine-threonine protein kinase [Streptomyces sp. NPDC050504]|uniref:serine-threonine protein kinase n=1 Tax=Streptomyces sp. NPDC050504 TaxID=3365618 RepID=UPI0037AE2A53